MKKIYGRESVIASDGSADEILNMIQRAEGDCLSGAERLLVIDLRFYSHGKKDTSISL